MDFEWIPRTLNDKADYFPKILDSDDWGLSSKLFDIISSRWGPFAIDWFGSEHKAKVVTFYTRFWCERTAGVDAFMEYWGGSNGYYVPPISQISSYQAYEKLKYLWCDGNFILGIGAILAVTL